MSDKQLHHGKIELGFMVENDRDAQRFMRNIAKLVMEQEDVDSISTFRQVKEWREVI